MVLSGAAMSLALVHSRAQSGVNAPEVRIEVHLAGGLPAVSIVGLPDAAVRESRDRVRAALQCSQLELPQRRITINRNLKSFLFAIVGAEYVLNMLPRGTHEYAKFIRPSELAVSCRAAELDLLHTRGLEYNPITQRYWLSADTSVNYLFATCRLA